MIRFLAAMVTIALMASCKGKTNSNVGEQGSAKTTKDKLLNTGADLLQQKAPIKAITAYLNGFHFYNGNLGAQMEAHHYVTQLSNDMYQAIIYDGNTRDAKIMGVEYIVTEKLFRQLPDEEKKLWHSHRYEVKSGSLIAPGIPEAAEHELMEKLVATYGKTIHTWHTDQERSLPIGSPMIMMAFTADGQLKQHLADDRDRRFRVSTVKNKLNRSNISTPKTDPSADAWQTGEIRQFVITKKADSAIHKH